MNFAKKNLTVLLAVVMMMTLVACGGAKTEEPDAPGSNGPSEPMVQETAESEKEENPASADTGVTMRVAAMTGPTGMGLVSP